MNDIKVFKMNDYEWWASRLSLEDTNDWYNKNVAENDIEEVKICDLDSTHMWYPTTDKDDIETIRENDSVGTGDDIGDLKRDNNEIYKLISLRTAIQFDLDFKEPYCIASTEY